MRLSGQKALRLFTGEEQGTTLNGIVVNDATGPKLRTPEAAVRTGCREARCCRTPAGRMGTVRRMDQGKKRGV